MTAMKGHAVADTQTPAAPAADGVDARAYLTKRRALLVLSALSALLAVAAFLALTAGSEHVPLAGILGGLWAELTAAGASPLSVEQQVIIFGIRLPRIALAVGVGAALALAGAAFQSLLRNPLADPYVLGVSSGAALGAIVAIIFASQLAFSRPLFSFAGAAAATFVIYLLARRESDPSRLVLSGVVISTMLSSVMVLLTSLADNVKLRNITFWLLGDLSGGSSEGAIFLALAVAAGALALSAQGRALNLMMVGERDAFALGVETGRVRWLVFFAAALLVGAAVATGGAIGYVGLVVPHLVRLAAGADNRLVLPASALAGALLVLIADTAARTAVAPRELPTGAITALVGAPVLVYLLLGGWRVIRVRSAEGGRRSGRRSRLLIPPAAFRTPHSDRASALLKLDDVSFSYRQPVLAGVSLDVRAGEILALLGPNGAGKSTLLSVAAGMLAPQSGAVTLADRPIASFSRREVARRVGLVAQSGELRFPLTALEYVLAGRFARVGAFGFDTPQELGAAFGALQATDAAHFAARAFDELSSGERQRVVLARALAQEPELLLLDEPTANLDLAHQSSLLALVRRLARERGLGAVVVTHEINLAAEFADRVALLKGGRLITCGAPREVMTAELLGEVFDTPLLVDTHPRTGQPRVSPL
jgi:iron complex transport system permease protein